MKDKTSISSIAEKDFDKEDLESIDSNNSSTISLSCFNKKPTLGIAANNPLSSIFNLVNQAKKQASLSNEATHDDDDDKVDGKKDSKSSMNKKTYERRLFRDLLALLSILSNSGDKLNVAEKFARRLQMFGAKKK